MPTYTYRREDGTTFDIRQKFSDDALQVDPETGQKVTRVIQSAGVIFKGSGFYVTDNRSANNPAAPKPSDSSASSSSDNGSTAPSSDSSKSNGASAKKSEKSSSPAAAE
ncbi:MAG: FmdB family zinc ribbon protein [Phototrophicaceae bacterium]